MESQADKLWNDAMIAAERADPRQQVGPGCFPRERSRWNMTEAEFGQVTELLDMRTLALGVISQAQKDLRSPKIQTTVKVQAMLFLIAPDESQRQWYDWAQVSVGAVRKATIAQYGEELCRKMFESASAKSPRMSFARGSTTGGKPTPGGLSQPEKVANSPSEVLFISGLPSTSATQSEAWTPREATWKRGVKSSSSPNHSEPSILRSPQRWPTTS